MALVLAGAASRQRAIARTSEVQIEEALVKRELIGVLDYVLERSNDVDLDLDPRFVQLNQFQEAAKAEQKKNDDAMEVLRQLLASMGMKIDLPGEKTEKAGEPGEVTGTTTAEKDRLEALYRPATHPFELKVGERSYFIQVWPINARPSLNAVPLPVLRRYLEYLGLSPSKAARLAGALVDWRDADDFTSEDGAELDAYVGFGYRPRNAPFESWQELNYVKGSSATVVRFLRSHFVLHGAARRVYAAHLSPAAMAALAGISEEQAARAFPPPSAVESVLEPTAEAKKALDQVVTVKAEDDLWLLRIQGGAWALQAVFRPEKRQLLDWTLDGVGPVAAPIEADPAANEG